MLYLQEYKLCLVGILGGNNMILLGDTFMRGQYIIHDMQNFKVAFGELSIYNFNNQSATIAEQN